MSGDHLSEVHQQGSSGAATHSVASASTSTYTASAARKKRRRDENEDLNNQRLEVFNQHTTWSAFEDSCKRTKRKQPSELKEMRGYINNTVAKHWCADGTKPTQETAYEFRRYQAVNPAEKLNAAARFSLFPVKPSPIVAPPTLASPLTNASSSSTSPSSASAPYIPDDPSDIFSRVSSPSSSSSGSTASAEDFLKSISGPAMDISQASSLKDIYPGGTFKLSSGEEVHILEYLKKNPMKSWYPYSNRPGGKLNRVEDSIRRDMEIRRKIMHTLSTEKQILNQTEKSNKSKEDAAARAMRMQEKEAALADVTAKLRKDAQAREEMIYNAQISQARMAAGGVGDGTSTYFASLESSSSTHLCPTLLPGSLSPPFPFTPEPQSPPLPWQHEAVLQFGDDCDQVGAQALQREGQY